jgi:ADP-ribose pyrophosphatase YjhB (NUDIX family)
MMNQKRLTNKIVNNYINEFERNPRVFANRTLEKCIRRIREEEDRLGIPFLDAIERYSDPRAPESERESYFVFYVQLVGITNCMKNDKKAI